MGIFGWSYPAGAENDPNAPYNQNNDGPCEVCGKAIDDCICPECIVCGEKGDPQCYSDNNLYQYRHGLIRTKAQIDSLSNAEAGWESDARAEFEYEAKYLAEMEKYDER